MKRYLIVGGVAGGMNTAARLRRLDESAEIVVFEKGEHVSFANCGLPYYIGNVITERDNLLLQTPASFGSRFNVQVHVHHEVLSIDKVNKTIKVLDHKTGITKEERYDKLVLSPGAEPIRPQLPGIENERIFTLRNIPDTDKIKNFIDKNSPKTALVVGAGFIGLEMAENLHARGINVSIVELAQQVMNVIDYEMAAIIHKHLHQKGISLFLGEEVSSFEHSSENIEVLLASGLKFAVDMVILSIGIRPEAKLAKEAGIVLGERGGIAVDEHLQTSDKDIYAVGDAIEVINPLSQTKGLSPLAGPANKQGRIVAENLVAGNEKAYRGTIGTAIAKVFDLDVAVTGLTEKALKKAGIPYQTTIVHSGSHAGYYPGAKPMTIKVQFSPGEGKLLGAEIVGPKGVDRRIDILAFAIQNGLTVNALAEFEHAYAPPYSSAKDPVNMAGFVASNILEGKVHPISWDAIKDLDLNKSVLLDVRTKDEFTLGHIDGALHIPVDNLRASLTTLPRDKKIVIYCAVGIRGYIAARILMQNGFTSVYNLSGGYRTYDAVTRPQPKKPGESQGNKSISSSASKEECLPKKAKVVDACGLACPGPIQRLKKEMDLIAFGENLLIKSSDPGFFTDVEAWAHATGNKLISRTMTSGTIEAMLEKKAAENPVAATEPRVKKNDKTLVIFSGELDKILAGFVIANGALSMNRRVTMFFTFWGINALRKPYRISGLGKNPLERMFGLMMPRGTKKLRLSKLHMGGVGARLIKWLMGKKNISSLERMIEEALASGVRLVACQMSMDLMGIKKAELIDGVEVGGVASFLDASENAGMNLFI